MRSIVLLHGGLHGGWCWKRVRRILALAGHDVVTPTLTGLGERAHLGGPEVDLGLHITDLLRCIEFEELDDFVLVAHSYGGMVATGAADRIEDRLVELVYLDAVVPDDGESLADVMFKDEELPLTAGMFVGIPNYDYGLHDRADLAWVRRRITPQSPRTMTDRLDLKSDLSRFPRHFIECADRSRGPAAAQTSAIALRGRRYAVDPSWTHQVLDAPHDCMISHPDQTAELILRIANR